MALVDKRRMCPNCRAFITTDDKICPYCQAVVGPKAVERRTPADALGGLIPHARFVTSLILLINVGLYIATVVAGANSGQGVGLDVDGNVLIRFGAKFAPAIAGGQWWRLITAGFLHGGVMHILMNSWVLFDVGATVEELFGVSRYVAIYLVANFTGFLASYYWSASLSIGASAAILGLIGALIAHGVHERNAAMRSFYVKWVIYILVIGLLPIFSIDNAAHLGGLAGGFAVGYLARTPGYSQTMERVWQIVAGATIAITLYAFFQMAQGLMAAQ